MAINLCNESSIFSTYVFESAIKLIDCGIWKIPKLELLTWRKNFKSQEEIFLSACLVDSLVYRTNAHIISTFQSLFFQHLPSQIKFGKFLCTDNPIEKLVKKQNTIKIVTANTDDEYGKSSHLIANILIKHFNVLTTNIISPEQVNDFADKGTMLFIYTDDFLGTGDQFITNFNNNYNGKIPEKLITYCPLIAHEKGINAIKHSLPELQLIPVEIIREDYCFFKKYFSDRKNDPESAKKYYVEFLKNKGFKENFYGHGDLGVSVAFENTIPDNSLLAFWGNDELTNNNYSRLFKR